ncbi:MAG TPA: hypothetical protein IAA20_11590 [Candidatus Enterococcus avicola]|uniref:Uncharacterized protein n=1 Tax=Candidatus Enterococcus avicola TaxID=2838561 RepID=A0A9D2FA44_9ENTE|nr:hypothetical protein [Candidatus Enterococcus avicola]
MTNAFREAITDEISTVIYGLERFKLKYTEDIEDDRNKLISDFSTKLNELIIKFDAHINQVTKLFDQRLEELEKVTAELTDKKVNNDKMLENMKFIFTNLIFVLVAVVLVRALFYGVWEGLLIKNVYEWGIQWAWLKYTMWGLFAGISGAILWVIFKFIKSNFKYNS